MAWGKTDDEKAARAAEKDAERYAKSPLGQAEAAKANGDGFFQFELDLSTIDGKSAMGTSSAHVRHSGGRPDLLGQIEELGFRLEHAGYVYIETGATTTNRMGGTGQGVVNKGVVRGIYLFRNLS
jgi:hypothetical protein